MLPTTFGALFLVVHIICNEAIVFKSFYASQTNDYPKSSCHKISNIKSKSRCLGTCIFSVDSNVMISHDESTKTCMCCSDISGDDITGPNWKSYVPRTLPCPNDYANYYLMPNQICLKYFPESVSYSTAQANCKAEGSDLIKIDSQEKYDIFKDYHVPIAKNVEIEVWVQGEKVGGQWQFDDGTPIPNICPIKIGDNPDQLHFRAKSSNSFNCSDAKDTRLYNYSCEYHLLSSFNN